MSSDNQINKEDQRQEPKVISVPAGNLTAEPKSPGRSVFPLGKAVPVPFILLFLIILFLAGLTIAVWYFQVELQKLNSQRSVVQNSAPTQKMLIIGTDPTDPPMEFRNKQGDMIGYDIDLGYRIGNELGVKVQFKYVPWESIFQTLDNGKLDMILSSVTITDERKRKFDFSEPYINAGQVIVSRKNNQILNTDQLKGKKISVQKDTTNEKVAYEYTSPSLVLSFVDLVQATQAVADGRSDAMISDLTLAKGLIRGYDNLQVSSDPFTSEYYGIVFRKDEQDLRMQVDNALEVLRNKGTLNDLKQKWLE